MDIALKKSQLTTKNIINRHSLQLLSCLFIALGSAKSVSSEWLYTVRPGDTFWGICETYTSKKNCWQILPDLNNVERTRELPPGFIVRVPSEWLKTQPKPVTVLFVNGDVKVQTYPEEVVRALKSGEKLYEGAIIETRTGSVSLMFADGSNMLVEPETKIVFNKLSVSNGEGIVDTDVRLNRGAVKTRVNKKRAANHFQITTPTAVAAVRGTEYRVSTNEQQNFLTRSEVYEGKVNVAAYENAVDIPENYGLVAYAGTPLTPKKLLDTPVFKEFATEQSTPISIKWHKLENAEAYSLEFLQEDSADELIKKIHTEKTKIETSNIDTGCYTLRLRGIDEDDLQGNAATSRVCIIPFLAAPQLFPPQLDNSERKVSIDWDKIDDAEGYIVELAHDAGFKNVIHSEQIEKTQYVFTPSKRTYIRVFAAGKDNLRSTASNTVVTSGESNLMKFLSMVALGALIIVL